MRIGIPKETKNNENRVALPPEGVHELIHDGQTVCVERGAGVGSGIQDAAYQEAGATLGSADDAWASDMVMKVKEPTPAEYHYLRPGLLLFTYLHLAANKPLTEALLKAKVNAVAYENVQKEDGSLPLLSPMSEIAGSLAAQIGTEYLEKNHGGKGILLAGVPGVRKGRVVVIGGGVSGTNAARVALGLGARVTILDVNVERLKEIDDQFNGRVQTLLSNTSNIANALKTADVAIGAVLLSGHRAPTLVSRQMVRDMPDGSVIVDIAIDQGGIFETGSRVTTHDDPTYVQEGVIHYAVANMPGAVPQTATYALSNATIGYARQLASTPLVELLQTNQDLYRGTATYQGHMTLGAAAADLDIPFTPLNKLL
ncbi:alanine dehydrogenase [Schleiferilactobacillus harbinensis]|uniref:alanine dehydrogenase n=1 Tax=Schleiferilactobacillus harbinensis TaxID=304207 RepID=UPI00116B05D0|nr:alanine dehydrogenase [Schleiferilactobacillus harbinensis]GEK05391.1 alanine dehydrogenase [Schleiferilactobacillus harbinensis]